MTIAFYSPPPRPANEAMRQAAVEASGVLAMTDASDLRRIVAAAAALFDAPMAAVSVIDGDRQYLVARTGTDARQTSRAISFCGHAILSPAEPLVLPDATADPRFAGNPLSRAAPNIRFYVGMPLLGRGRLPLGALCVLDDVAHAPPGEGALHALAVLSAEAGAAIYAGRDRRDRRSMM